MEVSAEAKRIMVVALGKLYSSRAQRGGVRLHRSLLLTLVMKSARDIYHEAQTTAEGVAPESAEEMATEPSGPQEPCGAAAPPRTCPHLSGDAHGSSGDAGELCAGGPVHNTRKRRSSAAAEPDFLPCKKAKLELGNYSEQLLVNSALVDYVKCGSNLGGPSSPIHLQTAIAAC